MVSVLPVHGNNLYAWYPLLQGMSRTVDYSGLGRTLTETGTITVGRGPPVAYGNEIIIPDPKSYQLDQEGFRWRNDDGDEDAATWRELQDVQASIAKNTNVRLRAIVNATGNPSSLGFKLKYRKKGGGTGWYDLTP
jgi:hypothetical protein